PGGGRGGPPPPRGDHPLRLRVAADNGRDESHARESISTLAHACPRSRAPISLSPGSGLLRDDRQDGGEPNVEEHAPRRNAQGLLRAGERRPARLDRARPLLRELARLP